MNYLINAILVLVISAIIVKITIPVILKIVKLKNLYDEPNERSAATTIVPTLGGVAIFFVATAQGDYYTLRLRFAPDYSQYDCEQRSDIDDPLNFTVLDKGIMLRQPRAGTIEVTPIALHRHEIRLVDDAALAANIRLANDNGRVVFTAGDTLYSLSLHPS